MVRLVDGPWRPGDAADPDGFADAVGVALSVERRAEKSTLSRDDVRRYHLAVRCIERHARHQGPTAVLGAQDVAALAQTGGTRGRLARSFHPPWTLAEHQQALNALEGGAAGHAAPLVLAVREAMSRGVGYVITIETGHLVAADVSGDIEDPRLRRAEPQPRVVDALDAGDRHGDRVFADDVKRLGSMQRVRAGARRAIGSGEPLPVGSGARHDVLTELLRELQEPHVPSGNMRILYVDSSEPIPFPVGGGEWRPASPGRTVRLGLMSMRHTKLDLDVDGYWFRNRAVSLPRTLAETDASCADQSIALLHQLSRSGVTYIELVHTGFEPAAVGCYRAIARWLGDPRCLPIRVQPYYLNDPGLLAGTPWGKLAVESNS
jgi:hypothetical protein